MYRTNFVVIYCLRVSIENFANQQPMSKLELSWISNLGAIPLHWLLCNKGLSKCCNMFFLLTWPLFILYTSLRFFYSPIQLALGLACQFFFIFYLQVQKLLHKLLQHLSVTNKVKPVIVLGLGLLFKSWPRISEILNVCVVACFFTYRKLTSQILES